MAYRVFTEGTGPLVFLFAQPLTPARERSGHVGPLTDRALMSELAAFCRARCVAAGYSYSSLRGGSKNTWHFAAEVPRRDAQPLIDGLTAYLEDLNEIPLRSYMRSPADLRARPGVGESWAHV